MVSILCNNIEHLMEMWQPCRENGDRTDRVAGESDYESF